jgi:hypothetical protein
MSKRWSIAIAGGVAVVAVMTFVLAGPVAGHPAASTAGHPVAVGVKDLGVANAPGRSEVVPIRCGQDETSWGYVGALRPGAEELARHALGKRLLAQVRDSATGKVLDLIGLPVSPRGFREFFTAWGPAYPQAKQPALLSCNYLLADKPADQPVVTAAIRAVVQAGYMRSAARARQQLLIVTVSDNPLTPLKAGHVIVTLMFNGGPCQKLPNGPTVCGYITDTVLETWPGATVTGTARGGF